MDVILPICLFVACAWAIVTFTFDHRKAARLAVEQFEREGRLPTHRWARMRPSRRAKVYAQVIERLIYRDHAPEARQVVALLAALDEEKALEWKIVLARQGRETETLVTLCRRALEFHAANVEHRVLLAESLLALDRIEEALEAASWAEENRDPALLRAYGDALEAAGEGASADVAYEEAKRVEAERERAQKALELGMGA